MSDEEQKEVFSKNLNRFVERSEKSQKEIADAIGVSPQTFNTWCQGKALPRMGKVQKLADYFKIDKSNLLEKYDSEKYYLNEETAKIAQEIFENRDLRILFDTARGSTPEGVKAAISVMSALRKEDDDIDGGC